MRARDDLALLEASVREAGSIARQFFGTDYKRWSKGGGSPVTEADLAVDRFLCEKLTAARPDYGWLSEETEDDPAARATNTVWIVDPIDGTRAFITKRPDWTICVALVDRGRPQLAGVYAPVTNEMFVAAAGRGATRNGAPIGVSAGSDLGGVRAAGPRRYLDHLAALTPGTRQLPKVHSLALRLTRVAEGAFDVALSSPGSHDWDLAAADLLIHEAGGVLTDIAGHGLRYNLPEPTHGALIATGAARHGPLVGLMRDRLTEFV